SVESVVLDNETEINLKNDEKVCAGGGIPGEIGIVIFTAGVKPSLKFIEGTTIKYTCGGISVNEHMETNVSGVYACGDCAEFKSAITGNVYPGKLATNAVPMAKVLADNLKGYKRKYEGFFNGAATKILDVYLGSAGLSEKEALRLGYEAVAGYSDVTTKFPVMPGVLKLRTKLVADRKTGFLLGGQVVSGEPVAARVDVITMALQNRATVEGLMNHSYSAQPYQSSYPAENCLVAAAEQLHEKIRA
ncbi:MAG TPA: FAD-binding protein, partial [bacterium]|nr:FAD-binding protein [bacterium]